MLKKLASFIDTVNTSIAVNVTIGMSTIWCVYGFFAWSILPLFLPQLEPVVAYISADIVQLVALPAIMVGQAILSRKSEQRAEQDHQTLLAEFDELRVLRADVETIKRLLNDQA